jgi:DNA-binding transcriptional MerR regulator/effector-binding domain-containing protein
MATRIAIGDFSRASQLSVKTLRHYHEVGLLEPAEIDPGNGYRHYDAAQIPTAQVIRRLRGLQMPVPEIRAVLAAEDPAVRNRLIAEHLDRLETELARTRAAVGELRDLLAPPPDGPPIERRSIAPTTAVAVQDTVEHAQVLDWWHGALGELAAIVRAQHLTPTGPPGGLYEGALFERDVGHAIVFVPVAETARAVGRVTPFTVPGAELAVVRHRGALGAIDLAYGALGAYVARHAIGVDGPLRETYLRGLNDTPDQSDWETEIGWPIFRAG